MYNHFNNKNIIITGGYGFIGNHLLNRLLETTTANILVIDSLTYAATQRSTTDGSHKFLYHDICSPTLTEKVSKIFDKVHYIFHLAAESHVDNSIASPEHFIQTNVTGTYRVLELVKKFDCRLIHVSTDEVYGHLSKYGEPSFVETQPLSPRSPYAASKAASDLLVGSYKTTYNLNTVITRCCNNFGIYQHSEKLIPKSILSIFRNTPIELYGNGENVREWIHASEHADALLQVALKGRGGEIYNVGSDIEMTNIQLIYLLINYAQEKYNINPNVDFIPDRPGHDFRYSLNTDKFKAQVDNKKHYTHIQNNLHELFEFYKAKA